MKKILFVLLFIMTIMQPCICDIHAQSYEQMWEQLDKYADDDLPKQVISQAEKILYKAQKENQFAHMMRAWKTIVERKTDIEPDSFKVCIEHIGKLSREKKARSFSPVQSSVYNAMMGSAYRMMMASMYRNADKETRERYKELSDEHYNKVLIDMEALAKEKSNEFKPLLKVMNADSRLFDNDMLSIMIDFIKENAGFDDEKMADIYAKAADLYKKNGNMNAYTIMTMNKLSSLNQFVNFNKRLKAADYYKSLKALLDESQELEVGVDVAQTYLSRNQSLTDDEKLEFARWAKVKFKQSSFSSYFENTEKKLLCPSLNINYNFFSGIIASKPFKLNIYGNNVENLKLEIRNYNGKAKNGAFKKDGRLVQKHSIALLTEKENIERKAKNLITKFKTEKELTLPAGHYVVIAEGAGCESVRELHITSIRAFCFPITKAKSRVTVVDNETGRPVPNVYLMVKPAGDDKTVKVWCDNNGEALVENENYSFIAYRSETDFTDAVTISSPERLPETSSHVVNSLFTDRSIYRPGQIVHLSGIVYRQNGDETNVVPNYSGDVYFLDANRQKIENKPIRTDAMGTFSSDFKIPSDRLPGAYTLRFSNSSVIIHVEEYKRPTFQVEMKAEDSDDSQLTFGDTVDIKAIATTYSGVPVQDAVVKYTIKTAQGGFWPWDSSSSWTVITEGESKTDANGKAVIPLFLDNSKYNESGTGLVKYRVYVDITDQAGETHSAEYTKSVSKQGFGLFVQADDIINTALKNTVDIKAKNCNGDEVQVNGYYSIYPYDRYREKSDTIKGEFSTDKSLKLPSLDAGSYYIQAYAYDKNNNKVSVSKLISVYNGKLAADFYGKTAGPKSYFASDFIHCDDPTFGYDKPAEFYFSPCMEDVYVYYYITNNDSVIKRGNVVLNKGMFRIPVKYLPTYGNGLTYHFFYVKDGQMNHDNQSIQFVEPNKKLTLSWKSFRDKLQPGQNEEWILNVKDHNGKPVNGAHLLAGMYDSSLDAIYPHYWSFGISYTRWLRYHRLKASGNNSFPYLTLNGAAPYANPVTRKYDTFVEYFYEPWKRNYMGRAKALGGKALSLREVENAVYGAAPATGILVEEGLSDEASATMQNMSLKRSLSESEDESSQTKKSVIRTNFDETAFFMPDLMTDAEGNAHIRFTLPESLTEWKFMGLAHTKDVQYGNITAKTVAQKDFMIQPNLPRFVRDGDKVTISTRIINRCDKRLNGKAYLRLIDPETEKTIFKSEQPFVLQANNTSSVDFEFIPSMDYPLLVCEIIGETNDFSDGERNYIPVLTSKKFITESIPFYLERQKDAPSTVTLDLNDIFNQNSTTATQKKMIFEFTENPEWSIIESLKTLRIPKFDNAPAFGASLYSNYMAQRLVEMVPGLKEAVELGLNRKDNQSDINSKLADNQELKDILLNESPWVLDALGEEQKRNELLDYFNEHLVNNRIATASDKLYKLQLQDGSWSWFEGMKGSHYITLSVAEQLAYLLNATTTGKETKAPEHYNNSVDNLLPNVAYMVYKAMDFLDDKEYKEYEFRKKHKYSMMPSNSTLRYLYLCTILPYHRETKKFTTMRDAYLKEVEKDVKNLTIYGRANAALMLRHYGHNRSADKFMQSVIEYSVYKSGMGRYFSTDNAYYSWMDYRIPTQISVMRSIKGQESSINAILNNMGDKQDASKMLNDMQIWLLRQKQTQIWDNPITIVDVIDFMLKMRQDENGNTLPFAVAKHGPKVVLHGNNESVQIETPLDTTKFLAEQLGYVNTVVDSSAYKTPINSMDVTLEPTDNSGLISWGALYTQYLEDLDKIQSNSSGELKVETKFYLVPQGSQDKTQEIVDSNTIIHVGDKVMIRVIVTADRDMDFVQIRAQHPACFEPTEQLSGYRWMNGRGGYVAHHDSHTDVFYDTFNKGTTTIDLNFYVNRTGLYQSGVVTAQCAYAPEFVGHTAGRKVSVK